MIICQGGTYKPHCLAAVEQTFGCGIEEKERNHFPWGSHKYTCPKVQTPGRYGFGDRTNSEDGCSCWEKRYQESNLIKDSKTYFRFVGSRSRSFWSTRISILLASRYFGIARIILIATLVLVSVSMASTTLPKVPWPNSRTVRSLINYD